MRKLLTSLLLILSVVPAAAQWACGDTLVDPRDGKQYITVPVGSDCWMAQNLNYGQYVPSTVGSVQHSDVSNDGNIQKYCQNNDSMNCITYGGLYDWDEMMNYSTTSGAQGICPPGWHVATDAEWTTMIFATGGSVSGQSGIGANAMKAIGTGVGPGTGTNTSGFSALAGGDRDGLGVFYGTGARFIFWTSTTSTTLPWQYTFWDVNDSIYRWDDAGKQSGFSCRCVQDVGTGNTEPGSEMNGYSFRMFPNPAHDRLLIVAEDAGHTAYRITDVSGREIMVGMINGEYTELDLSSLSKGIYIVMTEKDGVMYSQKLIVE